MKNTHRATVLAHDEQARASWLAWNGMRVRVPLASRFPVGTPVAWTIPSEQVRLPSRSGKPVRDSDTEFPARLVAIAPLGGTVDVEVQPLPCPDCALVMTVSTDIARGRIHKGDEVVLRLRGESIEVSAVGDE